MRAVAIKGTGEGITVVLKGEKTESVISELEEILLSAGPLLEGNKVILEVKTPDMGVGELGKVLEILKVHGIEPEKIVSDEEKVCKAAYALGLEVERSRSGKPEIALVKRGPIRSGQRVVYEGSIVIIGDVNPGAEVVAGGDVIVLGHLKGAASAGTPNDPSRRIYALHLEPTLIRIGPYIARSPEGTKESPSRPEVALVQGGQIVVEELD